MNNYLLKTNEDEKIIIKKETKKAYNLNSKNGIYKGYKIKRISIYDEKLINNFIIHKLNNKFNKLALILNDIFNSDDATDSDYQIVLDEIEKLKEIINTKYQNFLKKEEYNDFINKLMFARKIINDKIYTYEEEKSHGR